MTAFIIPFVLTFLICYALFKKVDVISEFLTGAKEGLATALNILPSLIILMTAIAMLRASGGLDYVIRLLSPAASLLGIPMEVMPLALLRPLSGSGALSMYEQILVTYGGESYPALVASTLMGSTETTFYVVAVYFGSVKVTKTRHTIPCALLADLCGVIFSALLIRIMF